MVHAKEEIEISITPAITVYGGGLEQKIAIREDRQVLYKRNNTYNILQNSIQGIGLVSGVATDKDWDDYRNIKNKIFMQARNNKKPNPRVKNLNIKYIRNKEYFESNLPLDNNDSAREIESWFKQKKRDFSNKEIYKLESGFTINYELVKSKDFYNLSVKIHNNSDVDLLISNVKKWNPINNSLKEALGVSLNFSNDDFSEAIPITDVFLVDKNYLDKLEVKSNQTEILKFDIPRKNIDEIVGNRRNVVSYIDVNLNIESNYNISGPFNYTTKFMEMN